MEAENKKDLTFNTGQNGVNKENYGLMQRNVSCILTSHDDVKVSYFTSHHLFFNPPVNPKTDGREKVKRG